MIATLKINSRKVKVDLSKPIDLSIALRGIPPHLKAWQAADPTIMPYKTGNWVGSIAAGASVNFFNLHFNPHAHITHTESYGHIDKSRISINDTLKQFFFLAEVITIAPEKLKGDFVISRKQLQYALGNKKRDAVIIRTLPNFLEKKTQDYSRTNPTYLLSEAAELLVEKGVQHLLVDLPSIDKEDDGGALLSHKAFWGYPDALRVEATITEFIFVPNAVEDGSYFLNLQVAPIENDASPSRPVLYEIME